MIRILSLAAAFLPLISSAADRLVLCGMDEVFVISADASPPGKAASAEGKAGGPEKLWSWRAKDRPELPEPLRKTFATTDEVKVLPGGAQMLVTSSSGGCALIGYPSGKVLWHARVPNAHSIEALPGNRVVVASSTAKEGNRLVLFDLARPGEPLSSVPLPSAHGVIWDERAKRLWALGLEELRRYEIITESGGSGGAGDSGPEKPAEPGTAPGPADSRDSPATPVLRLEASFRGDWHDGHDLQEVPGSTSLLITAAAGVWLFDRKTETFRPHPELADKPEVKSVSMLPGTLRTVWTMAGNGEWWTRDLRFLNPESTMTLPDEKLYKARWMPPAAPAASGE